MIRIRLAEEDRQRYQLDEWIEYDPGRPRLSEIRRLKAEVDWTWSHLDAGLRSENFDDRVAARAVLWWLAVNRRHAVSWDDFDCDVLGAEWEQDEAPNPPAPNGASTGSTNSARKSRGSTASRSTTSKS